MQAARNALAHPAGDGRTQPMCPNLPHWFAIQTHGRGPSGKLTGLNPVVSPIGTRHTSHGTRPPPHCLLLSPMQFGICRLPRYGVYTEEQYNAQRQSEERAKWAAGVRQVA